MIKMFSSVQLLSHVRPFATPWTWGLPVDHQFQSLLTHVHCVSDTITISSSVISFSSCLQSFPVQGLFQWVSSSHQVAKVLEFQLQHQSFQWILDIYWISVPCGPRDSQESFPTPQFKSINSSAFGFVYSPTLTSIQDYWKNHSFG